MSTASLSIDRSSLSKAALAITSDGAVYRLALDGFGRPGITWRTTMMPESQDVHGSEPIAAVKEQTSIPVSVIVLGATWADVEAAIDELDEALSQFAYTVTQTVDGAGRTWSASPASWSTDPIASANVDQAFEVVTITIPVYPIPGVA